MTLQAPPEWLAIHTNMPATVPAPGDVAKALRFGDPALDLLHKHGFGHAQEMTNRPQTV